MNNYKVLFSLRTLKDVLISFIDSFLVLYFLDVSANNILPLGIYKLVAICAIYIVIFSVKNFCKSKHRVNLMRIGIILDFIYFLTIIILRERVVDYIYLVGLLYGLEEGFYYSVYNMLESDGVTNEERAKYTGTYTATKSILSIIFPLVFGSLIYTTGFIKTLSVIIVIVVFRIILSFMFKDKNIPKSSKVNFKEYRKIMKQKPQIKQAYKMCFFSGLTFSEGAFKYIVTIYIIKVFSDSFSLGVFTSIASLISCVMGILFVKFIKPKHYKNYIKISMFLTIIALCVMIYKCNMITIVVFNLLQTFAYGLTSLINNNSEFNISNIKKIKKEYKVEYFLGMETALFIGRVISNTLFIIMTFMDLDIMIYIFVVFVILFALSSIKLQKTIENAET